MSKTTVVVVDDSPVVLASVVELLTSAGMKAEPCDNPILIAGALRTHRPQVLLLDVDMPGLTGPQAVEILRRNDALNQTRVLLYSSRDSEELRELARQCGAVGSVPKGDPEALLAAVHKQARQASSARLMSVSDLVFCADPRLEERLLKALETLGRPASPRGTVGIDRAVRESRPSLIVVEVAAFATGVDRVLERLNRRGLLDDTAVLGIGEPVAGLRCLSPTFTTAQLEQAIAGLTPAQGTS